MSKIQIEDLEEFDLGFTTFSANEVNEVKEYQDRLSKVRKMIIPFLENLMRDPDKDIHWPNRDVKIGEFKRKLEDIIEYGEVQDAEKVKKEK
jgi:hypothetical protein